MAKLPKVLSAGLMNTRLWLSVQEETEDGKNLLSAQRRMVEGTVSGTVGNDILVVERGASGIPEKESRYLNGTLLR